MGTTPDPDNIRARRAPKTPKGHDVRALGPSDSTDTGSDVAGPELLDDDVLGLDQGVRPGADIDTDRVVGPDEVGLGDLFDEAEEAQLERERGEH